MRHAAQRVHHGDCAGAPPAPGVGPVPYADFSIPLGEAFRLASGERLAVATLSVRMFGPDGAPVIAVAGGISATRRVCDADDGGGWWRDLAGPGAALNTNRFRILGFDFLPGGESDALTVTVADQARALALALTTLGIEKLHGIVGASYGGFTAMAFAEHYPERLARLCVISAAARPDPMATALRGVQRRIIKLAGECGRAQDGVALARELAMTTYRTAGEFSERFNSAPRGARAGDPYDVCEYLMARGRAYADKTPAARYLSLSDSLDRAVIDCERIVADCLFIASASDRLVPAADTRAAAEAVTGRSSWFEINSVVGHDAFLCDTRLFGERVRQFMEGRDGF